MIEWFLIFSSKAFIDIPDLWYFFLFFSILIIVIFLKVLKDLLDDVDRKSIIWIILYKSRIILMISILLFPITVFSILSIISLVIVICYTIYIIISSLYLSLKDIIFRK